MGPRIWKSNLSGPNSFALFLVNLSDDVSVFLPKNYMIFARHISAVGSLKSVGAMDCAVEGEASHMVRMHAHGTSAEGGWPTRPRYLCGR